MEKKVLGLCEARHDIPTISGYIFGNTLDPLDIKGMEQTACSALEGVTELDLYVTGLSVALLSVVKVCEQEGISLTCYHFDRESEQYYPQRVLSFGRCPFCGSAVRTGDCCPNCGAT